MTEFAIILFLSKMLYFHPEKNQNVTATYNVVPFIFCALFAKSVETLEKELNTRMYFKSAILLPINEWSDRLKTSFQKALLSVCYVLCNKHRKNVRLIS